VSACDPKLRCDLAGEMEEGLEGADPHGRLLPRHGATERG
jgi:hypothetical protein